MQFIASNFTKSGIANNQFGGAAFATPATWVIKFFTNTLNAAGTGGIEIGADGYEPIEIPNNTTNFPSTTTGVKSNALLIESAEITEEAEVRGIGLFDENDNFRYYANFTGDPLTIAANTKATFNIGQFSFTVTGTPIA